MGVCIGDSSSSLSAAADPKEMKLDIDANSVVSINQETKGKKHKDTTCVPSNEEHVYLSEYEQVEEDLSEEAKDEGNASKGEKDGVHSIDEDSSIEVVEEEYVEEEYTDGEEYSDVEYIEEVIEEVIEEEEEEESIEEVLNQKEMTSKKSGEEQSLVPVSGVIQSNSCEKKRKTDVELVNAHKKYKDQEMPSKTEPELDSEEHKVIRSSGIKRKSRWDSDSQSTDHSGYDGNDNKPKQKKSRWDSVEDQEEILSPSSLDDFLKLKQQLLEIDLKLQRAEGSQGFEAKKIRLKLIKQRVKIVANLFVEKNHQFIIQSENITPRKLHNKIYVPTKEYPKFNFIGLILGPRGNNLKRMERETKTRIFLRGQGSVLEGRNAENKKKKKNNDAPSNCDSDGLHVIIEAHDQKSLDAGSEMVEKLLVPPEETSELKLSQLRELAVLNGMVQSDACEVCGDIEHFTSSCPLTDKHSMNFLSDVRGGGFPSSSNSNIFNGIKSAAGTLSSSTIDPSNVYVSYLPQSVDDAGLEQLFSSFGAITSARVVKDHTTGLSKSYGFVKYRNPTNASKAVEKMNGVHIEGKALAVRIAHHPPIPSVTSQGACSSRPIPEPIPGAVGLFGPPPSVPITPGSCSPLSQNGSIFARPGYPMPPHNFPASSQVMPGSTAMPGSLCSYIPQTADILTSSVSSTAPSASEFANFSGNPANFDSGFLRNQSYPRSNLFSSEKSRLSLLDPKSSNLSDSREHRTLAYHSRQVAESPVVPTATSSVLAFEEAASFPGNPDYVRTHLFR